MDLTGIIYYCSALVSIGLLLLDDRYTKAVGWSMFNIVIGYNLITWPIAFAVVKILEHIK